MISIKEDSLRDLQEELSTLTKTKTEVSTNISKNNKTNVLNILSDKDFTNLCRNLGDTNFLSNLDYESLISISEILSNTSEQVKGVKDRIEINMFLKDGHKLDIPALKKLYKQRGLKKKFPNLDFKKLEELYKNPPETLTTYHDSEEFMLVDPFVFRKFMIGIIQMVFDEMDLLIAYTGGEGCLAGDTLVQVSRAKNSYKWSMKKLYEKFNGIGNTKDYNSKLPVYTRSYDGSKVKLHKIKNVFYSGKKVTYTMTLSSGESIRATANHKFISKNGWTRLDNLKVGDCLLLDRCLAEKSTRKRIKFYDVQLPSGFHPYKSTRGRVEVHKLIYDANLNDMSLPKFMDILLNESHTCKNLKFTDPSKYHIHHKDGNHYNNNADNLVKLTNEEHLQTHGKEHYSNFSQGIVKFSEIVSIEEFGEEDTYDIECEDPYHNFVANNIIVHNSGKSTKASQDMFMVHWMITELGIVDYKFDINEMFFNTLAKLREKEDSYFKKPFRIFGLDEGNELNRQNWKDEEVNTFFQRLRRERYNQRIKFICIPVLGELITNIVLSRVNFIFETKTKSKVKTATLEKGKVNFYIIPRGDKIYSPAQKRELSKFEVKMKLYQNLKDKSYLTGIPKDLLIKEFRSNGCWGFKREEYIEKLKDTNETFSVNKGITFGETELFMFYKANVKLKQLKIRSNDVRYHSLAKMISKINSYFEKNPDLFNKYEKHYLRKVAEKEQFED